MSWAQIALQPGDVCRTTEGAPARYIGFGRALYVSAMTNDLCRSTAVMPKGGEEKFPLPTDEEVACHAFEISALKGMRSV